MVKNKLCAIVNLTENEDALKPLTSGRPIAALPFAARYRVLDFMLSSIAHAEIDSCALFISESGRSIYDHIRSGAAWNFDSQTSGGVFTYSQQNWKIRHLKETGGDNFYDNHRVYMERSNAKYVFVSGSKVIANLDVRALLRHHVASDSDITAVYRPLVISKKHLEANDTHFELDQYGQIVDMQPLSSITEGNRANINLNMYILTVEKLNEIIDRAEAESLHMEVDSLIRKYLLEYNVNVYEYTGYSANVETINGFYSAHMDMLDHSKFQSLFYSSQPILTKTKNGVPTYYATGSVVKQSIIATGVHIDGEVYHSIINRKVKIAKDAVIKDSIILQDTKIEEGAEVSYAIIDKGCHIKAGAKVIGTPDNILVVKKNSVIEA